ncbi:hypothetical protein GQ600_4124 [Phytophthora cactorum]|nr:hypothetical protein GQ600_4124 [Phytophthora cactorum]
MPATMIAMNAQVPTQNPGKSDVDYVLVDFEPLHKQRWRSETVRLVCVQFPPHTQSLWHKHLNYGIYVVMAPLNVTEQPYGQEPRPLVQDKGSVFCRDHTKDKLLHVITSHETPLFIVEVELLKKKEDIMPHDQVALHSSTGVELLNNEPECRVRDGAAIRPGTSTPGAEEGAVFCRDHTKDKLIHLATTNELPAFLIEVELLKEKADVTPNGHLPLHEGKGIELIKNEPECRVYRFTMQDNGSEDQATTEIVVDLPTEAVLLALEDCEVEISGILNDKHEETTHRISMKVGGDVHLKAGNFGVKLLTSARTRRRLSWRGVLSSVCSCLCAFVSTVPQIHSYIFHSPLQCTGSQPARVIYICTLQKSILKSCLKIYDSTKPGSVIVDVW